MIGRTGVSVELLHASKTELGGMSPVVKGLIFGVGCPEEVLYVSTSKEGAAYSLHLGRIAMFRC